MAHLETESAQFERKHSKKKMEDDGQGDKARVRP